MADLGSILLGGVLTIAGGVGTAWLTSYLQAKRMAQDHAHQKEMAAINHSFELSDQRRQRLQSTYEIVLNAALEIQSVLRQMQVIMENETEEARNKRLDASLAQALIPVNDAMVKLTLEDFDESQAVIRDIYEKLSSTFFSYTRKLRTNLENAGTGYSPFPDINKDRERVEELVKSLTSAMQERLAQYNGQA